MGAYSAGALNSQGFSQSIKSDRLPDYNHITHSGVFNENYFEVGQKAKELMEIHSGMAISNCDLYDLDQRNYFLSLFLKSSTDGEPRTRPISLAIALDVSGSMDGPLKHSIHHGGEVSSRITLAKRAILMLFEKLQPDDAFSLVVFHTQARVVIASEFVKDLDPAAVREQVNSHFQSGGTFISAGFEECLKNLNYFRKMHPLEGYQHRIVLLTDVNDNSVAGEEKMIREISQAGIGTTIIGVSTDFQSATCQKLIKVQGFNYLCAVEEEDLQTYLVDQFDYTFFPCVQDVTISIESPVIEAIKVFGSVDHDIEYPVVGNAFTVTKMKSGFPSALGKGKTGAVETKGGLMLVMFTPREKKELPIVGVKVRLQYSDMRGKQFEVVYDVEGKVEAEEFFSDEAARKGVILFYYTQTMRNLLRDMQEGPNQLSDVNKSFYLEKLDKLAGYCPQDKKEELQAIRGIIEKK